MAYPNVNAVTAKLSFAKIAAMPASNVVPALPHINRETHRKATVSTPTVVSGSSQKERRSVPEPEQPVERAVSPHNLEHVRSVIQELGLVKENATPSHGAGSAESFGDDRSQLSNSSLKQQSFDTKSIASVTTFAMDEKESIRPDDSASVRAVEEDDPHTGLSRHSSFQLENDSSANGHRPALRTFPPNMTIAARRYPGLTMTNPPRFGDLPVSPVVEAQDAQSSASQAMSPTVDMSRSRGPILNITPDDRLLEALTSPKDRLPLLQLEEKVLAFIHQSRDDVLELPPQNSFTRLLAHKLADYYGLAHQVNDDSSSVRIFRASSSISPVALAEVAKSIHTGPQAMSAATQVKIMRRAQLGGRPFSTGTSTAASSSVPSKATSENGGEIVGDDGLQSPLDGTPNRDKSKLTREEREAQYKAARDRIFSDFQESVTSESGSTGETSTSMSRSSSSSGKRKSRKHKTPRDDSFDSRSAFVAWGPMQMQQTMMPAYHDMNPTNAYHHQQGQYAHGMYSTNAAQPYSNFDPHLPYGGAGGYGIVGPGQQSSYMSNGWQGLQQQNGVYNVSSVPTYQHPTHVLPPAHGQYPQVTQSVQQSSGWGHNQFQPSYPPGPANASNGQWPAYDVSLNGRNTSYQYGQSPQPTFGGSVGGIQGNQSPVPHNYANNSRSLFNPQTRSFVPNHANRGGGRMSRKKGGSNARGGDVLTSSSPSSASRSDNASPSLREDSLQQKYGAPPTLPKKPPPSQVPPHFLTESVSNPTGNLPSNPSGSGAMVDNTSVLHSGKTGI